MGSIDGACELPVWHLQEQAGSRAKLTAMSRMNWRSRRKPIRLGPCAAKPSASTGALSNSTNGSADINHAKLPASFGRDCE